jgi:hypothetical protein
LHRDVIGIRILPTAKAIVSLSLMSWRYFSVGRAIHVSAFAGILLSHANATGLPVTLTK